MSGDDNEKYDIVLFGVTGFTGRLAAEYLLRRNYDVRWAACARNGPKAESILRGLVPDASPVPPPPPVLVADLVGDEDRLRGVVKRARVVLTAAGPFEKYGVALHRLCAEEGAHYADISGETSYLRRIVAEHDAVARRNGAALVTHCGNDCVPHDATVWEMNGIAKSKGKRLVEVLTLDDFPSSAALSGGTLTTAAYQMDKRKKTTTTTTTPAFDPLLTNADGEKSEHKTTVTHKSREYHENFGRRHAGPWIMAPVMANCVRRSNALLGYAPDLRYGDAKLDDPDWTSRVRQSAYQFVVGAALLAPPLRGVLTPEPGEGPSREDMDAGWLRLWGTGVMADEDGTNEETVYTLMHFKKDIGYLMTAELLVEVGMLLIKRDASAGGGVLTPAVAFGGDLRKRITEQMEVDFLVSDEPIYDTVTFSK